MLARRSPVSRPLLLLLCWSVVACRVDRQAAPPSTTPPDAAADAGDASIDGPPDDSDGGPDSGPDGGDGGPPPSCPVDSLRCSTDGGELQRCTGDAWTTERACPHGCLDGDGPARCARFVPLGRDRLADVVAAAEGGSPLADVAAPCLRFVTAAGTAMGRIDLGEGADCTGPGMLRAAGTGTLESIHVARVSQGAGEPMVVFVARSWTLPAGGRWVATAGGGILVLVATERISVGGTLDVGAEGASGGPGGYAGATADRNAGGGPAAGGNGGFDDPWTGPSYGGGGGGGHGGSGGSGGSDDGAVGGEPGNEYGMALFPLVGGGGGGRGAGPGGGSGGGGGGGFVLSAARSIEIAEGGLVTAPGAGGGAGHGREGGGGGGGAGGCIVLEAPRLTVAGTVAANGGGGGGGDGRDPLFFNAEATNGSRGSSDVSAAPGGSGADYGFDGADGADAGDGGNGGAGNSADGTPGASDDDGGGGGGGAAGRIFLRYGRDGLDLAASAVLSPDASTGALQQVEVTLFR